MRVSTTTLATSTNKVRTLGVVLLSSLISVLPQTNPATSADETPAPLASILLSQSASVSPDSVVVRSTPSSSSFALDLVTTSTTLPVPASNPVPAPTSTSALPSDPTLGDSQDLSVARTGTSTVPADVPTPQNTPLATSAAAPESLTDPPASDPAPARTSDNAGDSQDTPGSASTSKVPQTSAPAKGARKKSAKKTAEPKKRTIKSRQVGSLRFGICTLTTCLPRDLALEDWRKEHPDAPITDFEEYWGGLTRNKRSVRQLSSPLSYLTHTSRSRLGLRGKGKSTRTFLLSRSCRDVRLITTSTEHHVMFSFCLRAGGWARQEEGRRRSRQKGRYGWY